MVFGALDASPRAAWANVDWSLASRSSEAHRLLSERKWPEAAIALRALLAEKRANDDRAAVALDLSRALLFSGRREEAVEVLEQARRHAESGERAQLDARMRVISRAFLSDEDLQLYEDGLALLRDRRAKAARANFERVAARERDNVLVLTRLGQCHVIEGDYDSAAENLKSAARLDAREPRIALWLGEAEFQRGMRWQAIEALRAAYDGLHGVEQAGIWLGQALKAAGRTDEAIRFLENETSERPMHVEALVELARMLADRGKTDAGALMPARKALQLALSRFEAYEAQAPVYAPNEAALALDLRKKPEDLKSEIEKLLARVDGKIDEEKPETVVE